MIPLTKSAFRLFNSDLNVIPVGNSLTFGSFSTNPVTDRYPAVLQTLLNPYGATVYQSGGQAGQQWSFLTANSIGFAQFNAAKTNIYLAWEGTNSIFFGGTAQSAFNDCLAYCSALKAAHPLAKIVVMTTAPYYNERQGQTFSQGEIDTVNAIHNQYNTLIKTQGKPLIDTVIDLRDNDSPFNNSNFPDYTSSRFITQTPPYLTSGQDFAANRYVHFSASGYAMVANLVFNKLKSLNL